MSVSVIIPCFNSETTIERAVNSVFNQTLKPSEVICVDDGSSDSTLSILRKLKEVSPLEISFLIILQENSGPSRARNNAVLRSNCEYIAFLDSDDVWHPQKLEVMFQFILKYDLDFLYHLYSPLPYDEKICLKNILLKKKKRYSFALKNFIATPTVFVKKNKFPGFPEHLSYCEDYCCWLMSTQRNFYFIDKPLANGFKKPIGDSGLSSNIYKMHKGFIDALLYLKEKKKISLVFFCLAYIFEYLKFPLRYFR